MSARQIAALLKSNRQDGWTNNNNNRNAHQVHNKNNVLLDKRGRSLLVTFKNVRLALRVTHDIERPLNLFRLSQGTCEVF